MPTFRIREAADLIGVSDDALRRVLRDTVTAQVEIQAGPPGFVSLLSREAADELGLEPGVLRLPRSRRPRSPWRSPPSDGLALPGET